MQACFFDVKNGSFRASPVIFDDKVKLVIRSCTIVTLKT